MLVLSRKAMESVWAFVQMPDGSKKKIKIQVVGTGKMVRLGIEADDDVTILREELLGERELAGDREEKAAAV
jgi:sRNA-binding carbon storage regulator CsrA